MNTKIYLKDNPIALNLFRELERTSLPKGQVYTYRIADFTELARRFDINKRLIDKIVKDFKGTENKMIKMIEKSFLSIKAKRKYKETVLSNYKLLFPS
jgi:hypothetical protein